MSMQEEAKSALSKALDEMTKYYNRHQGQAPPYKEGDSIWLNSQNYATNRPTKKLDHKWLGPFKIIKVVSHAAVKLQLSHRELGIHPVISITELQKYSPDDILEHPRATQPGPTIIDGHEEYEVEQILNAKYI